MVRIILKYAGECEYIVALRLLSLGTGPDAVAAALSTRQDMETTKQAKGRRIDKVDREVIALLLRNPQTSNKAIAQEVGVAESTVANRIDGLVKDRLIKITVQQDIAATRFRMFGWIEIWCDISDTDRIAETIADNDDVFSVTRFYQNPYLLVVIMACSLDELRTIHETAVGPIAGIRRTALNASVGEMYIKSRIAVL